MLRRMTPEAPLVWQWEDQNALTIPSILLLGFIHDFGEPKACILVPFLLEKA